PGDGASRASRIVSDQLRMRRPDFADPAVVLGGRSGRQGRPAGRRGDLLDHNLGDPIPMRRRDGFTITHTTSTSSSRKGQSMNEKRRGRLWTGAVAGLVALAGVTAWTPAANAAPCADLNNDGKITIADAVRLIHAVAFGSSGADCGGM